MPDRKWDDDDFCFMERYIMIKGKGLSAANGILSMGYNALSRLYDLAENHDVPYALNYKLDYFANCDIYFDGTGLLKFVQEMYPEKYTEELISLVEPDEEYTVSCIDLS